MFLMAANWAADMLYAVVDPRISYRKAEAPAMALVRRAAPVDLVLPAAGEQQGVARRARLRRWLPIAIGLAMAAAMIVVAAAAPLIAPLCSSAQFLVAVLQGPGPIVRHHPCTD